MARTNKVSTQDDKSNQLMNTKENIQDEEGANTGEDVQKETDNEDQEAEDSSPNGEDQEAEDSSPNGEDQEAEGSSPNGGNQEQPESVPQILTATYPILYLSHQYRIGDALPAHDPEMVKAWLAAKTAVWTPAKAGKEGSGK